VEPLGGGGDWSGGDCGGGNPRQAEKGEAGGGELTTAGENLGGRERPTTRATWGVFGCDTVSFVDCKQINWGGRFGGIFRMGDGESLKAWGGPSHSWAITKDFFKG